MTEFLPAREQFYEELVAEQEALQNREHDPRALQQLAETALDGFTLMERVESMWQHVGDELRARIIDQPAAIDAIIDALDASEARLVNDHRPKACLAFLGPTGVGKSETAKALADILSGDADGLIKIDCSDYSHGHEIAGLTGAPAGYVGFASKKPVLSKKAVEVPGTIVLFDEIEKGSPELYNLLLQIMGDGQLRLNNGDITSFRDAIVILTSNLGAKEMARQLDTNRLGFIQQASTTDVQTIEQVATREFEQFFRPEFINRLDKMVVYHPLSRDGLGEVLNAKLALINKEYEDLYGVQLLLSDATKTRLVDEAATQSNMGARPVVRTFEKHIQTQVGRYLGSGQLSEGTELRVLHSSEMPEGFESESEFIFSSRSSDTVSAKTRREQLQKYIEAITAQSSLPALPQRKPSDIDAHLFTPLTFPDTPAE